MLCKTHKKTKLIALVLAGLIFLNVNFVSAAVNQTLKDALLPFVDIKYDYANGIIDEVIIYNRALSSDEINALYSLSPQGIGETWNCTIRAIDSTGAEGINSKAITIPGYALPNITGIKITPSPAYDDSELNCSAIYGNPDGNKGNITLSWYNGSSLFLQTTQYNKFSGETVQEPLTWVDRNGLVGYWKFSEGNGTQTRDISRNENNGTLNNFNWNANSDWIDGKYGKALRFDGVNDYVDSGNNVSFGFGIADSFSLEVWIKMDIAARNYGAIMGKASASSIDGYMLRHNTGGQLDFRLDEVNATTTSNACDAIASQDYRDSQWHHVVGVLNRTNNISYIYVDGIQKGTADCNSVNNVSNPTKTFNIGAFGTGVVWNGSIDEVRVWNRSLSSAEISTIYNNSVQVKGETWNCTINAIDSQGIVGLPNSITTTIGSQSAQNYTPKWVHITVTYNKATRQKKIYVNGNLTKTETLQGLSDYKINNQTGNLYAGKLYGVPSGNPFNGSIDEILISQKEKSAAEIWQDYLNNIIYGEMPGPNEAKTMAIEGENITEISIAPIVKVRNKEKTCDVTSKVKLPECVQ